MSKWRVSPVSLLQLFAILISHSVAAHPHPRYPCKPPHHDSYPFCNTSLSIPTRAQSLISFLTLKEKIAQLSNGAGRISRLGIPAYEWWSESLHGIAINGPGVAFNGSIKTATSFPQVLVTAAAFNRSLWFEIAKAIGVEARAMYNEGQAGLTFWAPNINIFRDPRWGRGQETPGEDPVVTAAYAVEYVKGFEGQSWGEEYREKRALEGTESGGALMLSACCKHFTAYDLEKWRNFSRYTFNAEVTKQDLEDTYQPPFRSCIQEGRASCLMCSYNQVNGIPACARRDLLDQVRNEWGFKGYITSDCDAVAIIYEDQKYAHSAEDAIADVLKAGMDINCGTYLLRHTESAVKKGKVLEKDIDRALFNLFSVQLRLGLFDGNPLQKQFGKLGTADVCTEQHRQLALEAARQGIVLLKNDNKFLPLDKSTVGSLVVIGPAANDTSKLGGGYTGYPCRPVSLYEGQRAYVKKTLFARGCFNVSCESVAGFTEAIHVAQKADYVMVVAGLDLTQETEGLDRVSLLLPGKQMELISAIANVSRRPLILVLMGGGPMDVSFAKDDPRIACILWVGYPGEVGGQAAADVVHGAFNPGGRLPVTWYPESFTRIPMNDMNMRANSTRDYPGRTYRFYTGDIIYGFGHGLSYSTVSYRFLSVPDRVSLLGSLVQTDFSKRSVYGRRGLPDFVLVDEVASCEALKFYIHFSVANNGDMDGSHVVMLFSRVGRGFEGAPTKQLIGFTRVHTEAYKATEASLLVDTCKQLSLVNDQGTRILPLGSHTLMLGGWEHSLNLDV
ncbi:probable beta-D-xylosidase 6 [Aristolochia californica]|uniref:probable beta-D-xylosidase 6 n=1 Tax=Aristolochia californica TaxID=171875 RepID=UPI0035DCB96F